MSVLLWALSRAGRLCDQGSCQLTQHQDRGTHRHHGASAGLGAALAARLCRARPRAWPDRSPRRKPCSGLPRGLPGKGATSSAVAVDVQDSARPGRSGWTSSTPAIRSDLVIVNAGIFDGIGSDGRLESREDVARLIWTSISKARSPTASAAAGLMRPRRTGHIALVASLAARQPLADAPVYSASKAGLSPMAKPCANGSRRRASASVWCCPGHIATPQTGRPPRAAAVPDVGAAAAAASSGVGLDRRRGTIAFPRALAWLIALGRWPALAAPGDGRPIAAIHGRNPEWNGR